MDFNQLELQRQTLFKDAVLSEAETKGMAIISAAQAEGEEELRKAKLLCEAVDEASITAKLSQEMEKEYSTIAQNARRELLQHRTELVDEMFGEVETRLAAFAESKKYAPWLQKRIAAYADFVKEHNDVKIFVRPQDAKEAMVLEKWQPGAKVEAQEGIRLGGFKIQGGNILYDETLDEALDAEKRRFITESGLGM